MTNHQLIAAALCLVGGIGGLAAALARMSIMDSLNTLRPADDQIPVFVTPWAEFTEHLDTAQRYGFFLQRELIWEFRDKFPRSSSPYWYFGGIAWMLLFGAAALIVLWG
jgi:hypothetical protein